MRSALFVGLLAVVAAVSPPVSADPITHGSITIHDPWARATAPTANNGVAFMMLTSQGDADRLVAVSCDVSETAELHTHIKDGEVMRMRPVEAIDIPAGGTAMLEPGGLHVMLIGLKQPLEEGATFPLTLGFENAGEVTVEVTVTGGGAMEHHQGQTMHHGDDKTMQEHHGTSGKQ